MKSGRNVSGCPSRYSLSAHPVSGCVSVSVFSALSLSRPESSRHEGCDALETNHEKTGGINLSLGSVVDPP